jgi:hypothetical protein
MLKVLIPFAMLILSLFFASKAFALDIVRVEKYDISEVTEVAALETQRGSIIGIKEIEDTSSFAMDILNRELLKLKNGKEIETVNIQYFYAKKLIAARAPKGDGGITGNPFNE